jgi:hypothetical protein
MIRTHGRVLPFSVTAAVLLLSLAVLARGDDASPTTAAKSAGPAKPASDSTVPPAAKRKPSLSPELAALRDQVRQQLAAHQKQAFNTRQNSATEILSVCLAFGCGSEVSLDGPDGRRINGITCLCWNYPCQGFELLGFDKKHPAARLGYGFQQHPGEFLAMLAMSRVAADYPVRIGGDPRKVADVVEAEKLGCRSGSDLSLKLIGLSYYVTEPEWKNNLGETWSIGRMIDEEIVQPIVAAPDGGLNRLMGLSYAMAHRAKHGESADSQSQRVQKYIDQLQAFALGRQNSDGSWGPYYLAARATSPDAPSQLQSTGRVLEWLAMSLPEEKLKDPRMLSAVECILRLVGSERYQLNAPALSTQEIVSWGHALHALAIYDARAFTPTDGNQKPTGEKQPAATANRDGKESESR